MAATFTWTTQDGTEYQVEPEYDVDQWTGREMRALERINGGNLGIGGFTTHSFVFAVSASRTVPGLTIEAADKVLTFGRIHEILAELRRNRDREAAAVPLPDEAPADEPDAVLSPTRPGEPGDTADRQL